MAGASLHQFQIGIGDDEPFRPGALEVDLHACVGAAALAVQHDTFTEFAVAHALANERIAIRPTSRMSRRFLKAAAGPGDQ